MTLDSFKLDHWRPGSMSATTGTRIQAAARRGAAPRASVSSHGFPGPWFLRTATWYDFQSTFVVATALRLSYCLHPAPGSEPLWPARGSQSGPVRPEPEDPGRPAGGPPALNLNTANKRICSGLDSESRPATRNRHWQTASTVIASEPSSESVTRTRSWPRRPGGRPAAWPQCPGRAGPGERIRT